MSYGLDPRSHGSGLMIQVWVSPSQNVDANNTLQPRQARHTRSALRLLSDTPAAESHGAEAHWHPDRGGSTAQPAQPGVPASTDL